MRYADEETRTRRRQLIRRIRTCGGLLSCSSGFATIVGLAVLVVSAIFFGCFFGIYYPIQKMDWKTAYSCRVSSVLRTDLGSSVSTTNDDGDRRRLRDINGEYIDSDEYADDTKEGYYGEYDDYVVDGALPVPPLNYDVVDPKLDDPARPAPAAIPSSTDSPDLHAASSESARLLRRAKSESSPSPAGHQGRLLSTGDSCTNIRTPMPLAIIELFDENGVRIESSAVACATKRARVLSSTPNNFGCDDLTRGNGYPYQLFTVRPPIWLCSKCDTDRECNTKWDVGDTVPTCKYTTDSPGPHSYVLWDRETVWYSSEYYAMWIVGFGLLMMLPVLLLLWKVIWSDRCFIYSLAMRCCIPPPEPLPFTEILLELGRCPPQSGETRALELLDAIDAIPPPQLPDNARPLVLGCQSRLFKAARSASGSAAGKVESVHGIENTAYSPAVHRRFDALLRRLPESDMGLMMLPVMGV